MNVSELPKGSAPEALRFEHFPTAQQAFVWRNWGLVEAEKLAAILQTSRENVVSLAEGMGLDPEQTVAVDWISKGYATLIRRNWHLLPYEQLTQLLGWSVEKLDYMLREDDFLYHKLGDLKPQCKELKFSPLTDAEKQQTHQLRENLNKHYPKSAAFEYEQKPFSFYESLPEATEPQRTDDKFSSKIAYAYSAPFGDTLLVDLDALYPEALLERLSASGINGVWLPAVLYTLAPWDRAPELSENYQKRLATLNELVKRAEKFGMGVYIYLNEPRPMPQSFFDRNPDWAPGAANESGFQMSLCTSQPETLKFVYDSTKFVFESVPGLAGVITISMSENLVHCHARGYGDRCPRCAKRNPEDVVVELNSTISRAVHDAAPQAKVIVWSWAWGDKWAGKAVDMLPDDVELMCVSEWGKATNVGGVAGSVVDYSISQVGPSETAMDLWRRAKARGMKTHAKVQLNNSWECSAVPYIPVPTLVEQHLENLSQCEVDGLLVSWTLGGYPGGNLKLLQASAGDLAGQFGRKEVADRITQGWNMFAEAFKEFPFDVTVLYLSPHNAGPSNLLFEKPSGYNATMVGIPYDAIDGWKAIYPREVFADQWQKLSEKWEKGLDFLGEIRVGISPDKLPAFDEMVGVAEACYCHFRSTYLQVSFVELRDAIDYSAELVEILDEEIELAKRLEKLASRDCRLGFEATNHYIYTPNDLREKVVNCEYLKHRILTRK